MVSIYRIGTVTDILYLRASMLMYLYTAHLSSALSVVRFNSSTRNATEHLQLL
jgi:cell division protein FtsL